MGLKAAFQNATFIATSFFIGYYTTFGPRGVIQYCSISKQVEQEKKSIDLLEKSISKLKGKINVFKACSFKREKIARYDFALGYTNELLYIFPRH